MRQRFLQVDAVVLGIMGLVLLSMDLPARTVTMPQRTATMSSTPTSVPLYGGNDLAIWFGSNSNNGVAGGPTVKVADAKNSTVSGA